MLALSLASCGGEASTAGADLDAALGGPGTEGNACYPNGTCNAGLSCLSRHCVSLPEAGITRPGTEGNACYPNGTCNAGLACLSQLCVAASGTGGAGGGDAGGTGGFGVTGGATAAGGAPDDGGIGGTGGAIFGSGGAGGFSASGGASGAGGFSASGGVFGAGGGPAAGGATSRDASVDASPSCDASASDDCLRCLATKCCSQWVGCRQDPVCGGTASSEGELRCMQRCIRAEFSDGGVTNVEWCAVVCAEGALISRWTETLFSCIRAQRDGGTQACSSACFGGEIP